MAPHPCLTKGCPAVVADRSQPRCPQHARRKPPAAANGQYDQRHRHMAKRTIARHVAAHGWWCPGWRREPHPVAVGGLTADHVMSIKEHPELAWDPANLACLCRPCNARKGHRSGPTRPLTG